MIKLLLGIITIYLLISVVSAISIVNTSHSEKNKETSEKTNLLCSKCIVGQQSYKLDEHSESCPYILCCNNGECSYFKPLKQTTACINEKLS